MALALSEIFIRCLHSESGWTSSRLITPLTCVRGPIIHKIARYAFNYYNCRSHSILFFWTGNNSGSPEGNFIWLPSSIAPKIACRSINSVSRKGLRRTVYGLAQYQAAAAAAKIKQTSAIISHATGRAAISWWGQLSCVIHKRLDLGGHTQLGLFTGSFLEKKSWKWSTSGRVLPGVVVQRWHAAWLAQGVVIPGTLGVPQEV